MLEAELLEEPSSAELVIVVPLSATLSAELAAGEVRARAYAADARAANTLRAYAVQWKAFASWCTARKVISLPAEGADVAIYLAELADAGRAAAGISLALTAISQQHKIGGLASPRAHPAVIETWKGIRRTIGTAQKQKAPLLVEGLRRAVQALPDGPAGRRDRALLLLGFAAALRRSELVAIAVEDLVETREGLELTIRRSKTDQEGKGARVGVPVGSAEITCPVRAVKAWRELSGITTGPLFVAISRWGKLSGQALAPHYIAVMVKRAAAAAGLTVEQLSGHSLRAGFATAAAKAGASERIIMKTTRHRSVAMVQKYIRDADLFADLGASKIGL